MEPTTRQLSETTSRLLCDSLSAVAEYNRRHHAKRSQAGRAAARKRRQAATVAHTQTAPRPLPDSVLTPGDHQAISRKKGVCR